MGGCGASGQKTAGRRGKIVDDNFPPINESLIGEYTRHKRQMETEKNKLVSMEKFNNYTGREKCLTSFEVVIHWLQQ